MRQPFLSLYTPTYKRPQGLAACLASVSAQTIAHDIEHLVFPDHIGVGIDGMYARIPQYVDAVHGEYVHILADDDVLADVTVVERVRDFAIAQKRPPLILVNAQKGEAVWPSHPAWPPQEGLIDLGCTITRADIWKAHVQDYGKRYEGDADFLVALHRAGIPAAYCDVLFLIGAVSHGKPEQVAA